MKRRKKFLHIERTRHGRACYYVRVKKGPRVRLPDCYDEPEFWKAYEAAVLLGQDANLEIMSLRRQTKEKAFRGKIGKALDKSLKAARQRAKKKKLPFDLDYDWAIDRMEAQDCRCELTGLRFFSGKKAGTRCEPMIPSFDRINPVLGYTKKNVRIVCFAINTMMLDWGENLFHTIVKCYRLQKIVDRKLALTSLVRDQSKGMESSKTLETIGN